MRRATSTRSQRRHAQTQDSSGQLLTNRVDAFEWRLCAQVSPAQALVRWAVRRGCSVIPRTSNFQRVVENFASLQALAIGEGYAAVAGEDAGGAVEGGCMAGACEEKALQSLDHLEPQQRRVLGEGLVGAARSTHLYRSLEELWE